jgi:hypothetical protein
MFFHLKYKKAKSYHKAIAGKGSLTFLNKISYSMDMYYHVDEMAKATKEVGLRAILGETVIKFPVVDAKQPTTVWRS